MMVFLNLGTAEDPIDRESMWSFARRVVCKCMCALARETWSRTRSNLVPDALPLSASWPLTRRRRGLQTATSGNKVKKDHCGMMVPFGSAAPRDWVLTSALVTVETSYSA